VKYSWEITVEPDNEEFNDAFSDWKTANEDEHDVGYTTENSYLVDI